MNKPVYAAIQAHSPLKPVLVFVSSRRQTRLTALDLIAYMASDERPAQFLHMPERELQEVLQGIKVGTVSIDEQNLRCIIGIVPRDRVLA